MKLFILQAAEVAEETAKTVSASDLKDVGFMILGLLAFIALVGVVVGAVYGVYSLFGAPSKVLSKYQNQDPQAVATVKKYPEADLRNFTPTFLNVGMIFALSLVLWGFTHRTYDEPPPELDMSFDDEFEIEPPQTVQQPPPPPPPPPPIIEVVEDEEILEEEETIPDAEAEPDDVLPDPIEPPEEEANEDEIFERVEEMPRFPGCENKPKAERKQCADIELAKYLAKCPYPDIAKENDITGKVFVKFVVDKDGSITNVEIARGANKYLDAQAKKWVEQMPKFSPGKQRGKPVRVSMIAPFNFKIK